MYCEDLVYIIVHELIPKVKKFEYFLKGRLLFNKVFM